MLFRDAIVVAEDVSRLIPSVRSDSDRLLIDLTYNCDRSYINMYIS